MTDSMDQMILVFIVNSLILNAFAYCMDFRCERNEILE
jgi:hypothetical protein